MDPTHLRAEPNLAHSSAVGATLPVPPDALPDSDLAQTEALIEVAAVATPEAGFSGVSLTSMRWRRLVTAAPPAETVARNPSLPTFVGLIMLILTFFIVLTSISINDRKKSDAAMASLQDAFSGTAMLAQPMDDRDAKNAARDFVAGLTGRIQSLVPLMGGEKSTPAEDQILWLPLSLAFADEAAKLQPTFTPVLQELLTAAGKIPTRFDYTIELRLCAGEASDGLRRRATALVDALIGLQAPLSRFVIGTQACQADRMAFAVALSPVAKEANP
jgi:hypothetical protein